MEPDPYLEFGLRVAHLELVLAPPAAAELAALAAIVGTPGAIVAADEAHYVTWPTGDAAAAEALLDRHRSWRTPPTPERWLVPFAVVHEGRPVGVVGLGATAWSADRIVGTRAWLARTHQGRGIGRRARLMLLEVAFAHLGAAGAATEVVEDNVASRRITERLGYREVARTYAEDGALELHYLLAPEDWRPHRLDGVQVDGIDTFRAAISP